MRIQILRDGPYHVTGGIPIREMVITPSGLGNKYVPGRKLPQREEYYLCRCGHTETPPFCNGFHGQFDFQGEETASREPYMKRVQEVIHGRTMLLADDGRCAYARFCHRNAGTVWQLTEQDYDPEKRKEALILSGVAVSSTPNNS